jgi:hypothetical protein
MGEGVTNAIAVAFRPSARWTIPARLKRRE